MDIWIKIRILLHRKNNCFFNSSGTCEDVIELLIILMIAEILLGYFFKRVLGIESDFQFVEFKEWIVLCTS